MNKTGLLLAVAMIVERIKNEGKVDVLRTVKDLRDYRPGIMSDFVSIDGAFFFKILQRSRF